MLLAGDIGGTKTVLGIFSADTRATTSAGRKSLPSADYDSLEEIALSFLARGQAARRTRRSSAWRARHRGACGDHQPAVGDGGRDTWRGSSAGTKARLLNDLDAIANAVPHLATRTSGRSIPGFAVAGGAIAVIAPGTGLGEAFLTWDGTRYRSHPSEGGHASFAPGDELQIDMLTLPDGQAGPCELRTGLFGHRHPEHL